MGPDEGFEFPAVPDSGADNRLCSCSAVFEVPQAGPQHLSGRQQRQVREDLRYQSAFGSGICVPALRRTRGVCRNALRQPHRIGTGVFG